MITRVAAFLRLPPKSTPAVLHGESNEAQSLGIWPALSLKWRAIRPQPNDLFNAQGQGGSLSCCPAEEEDTDLESVATLSSTNSAKRAERLAQAVERELQGPGTVRRPSKAVINPQLLSPPLFVPWSQVASLRGVVAVHKDLEARPHEELKVALDHPKCMFPGEKDLFLAANKKLLSQLKHAIMPLESIAPQVFQAIYQKQQAEILWLSLLRTLPQINQYWIGNDTPPLPSIFQINCGGLGGRALEGDTPPHFHCTCPPVGESQVYGPSLPPADVYEDQIIAVATGCTTGVHEVATLFAHTQDPFQKWEDLGLGKASLLYQRSQKVFESARLLPAHRRLPHKAFLSGLWWKLHSLQPMRLVACMPMLSCLQQVVSAAPVHFTINGFSAGSYTGAVIALAIRCIWPTCQITARLGAIAMPKGVLTALIATADPERHHYYLVHAAEDRLCDWKPSAADLDMLQRSLYVTYVEDSARWMGSHKHNYWHWLQCQLPQGSVKLAQLKLSHPDVIPRRDRIAAPMRLASWIRFDTVMTSEDWEGAISLLVANLHRSDKDLLHLLQQCVAGQCIAYWDVALVPLPGDFAPLPTPAETGLACPVRWAFPPSLQIMESRPSPFQVLAIAEVGDTVTADHLLQMATLAAEHKPTVLGIPGHLPLPYQLECTVMLLRSLHGLFQLLTTGGTLTYCPQAGEFATALSTAAREDNGHIISLAAGLALALKSGNLHLRWQGCLEPAKLGPLPFCLPGWLSLPTSK